VEEMAALRECFSADRCRVLLFHNGDSFINGSSILKLTCVHESVVPGVSQTVMETQGILVSTIPQAVDFLPKFSRENPKPAIIHPPEITGCYYQSILEALGTQSEVIYPLYKGADVIGLLSLHYTTKKLEASDISQDTLQQRAAQIELLVNKHQKPNWLLQSISPRFKWKR